MDMECMICLEENNDFVSMPCNHEVCKSCHSKLLKTSNECPFCRTALKKKEETPEYRIIVIQPREEARLHHNRSTLYCVCVLCLCMTLLSVLIIQPFIFLFK